MFIGNDLEPLTYDGRSSHFLSVAFLQKCFSDREMHYALEESSLLHFYAKYWTQKEAAYKLFHQKGVIDRRFNPLALEISKINRELSVCQFGLHQVFVKTMMTPHFAHSIAVEKISQFEQLLSFKENFRLMKIGEFPRVFVNGFWRTASKSHSCGNEIVVTLHF